MENQKLWKIDHPFSSKSHKDRKSPTRSHRSDKKSVKSVKTPKSSKKVINILHFDKIVKVIIPKFHCVFRHDFVCLLHNYLAMTRL